MKKKIIVHVQAVFSTCAEILFDYVAHLSWAENPSPGKHAEKNLKNSHVCPEKGLTTNISQLATEK